MQDLKQIDGFDISFHEKSKRIINIKIDDEIIERLIFPFKKFDITALEYKPFTRFTIAKSLDETTSHELGKFLNHILKNRNAGCFIIGPKNISGSANGTFAPAAITSIPVFIILSTWSLVINLDAAQGINTSDSKSQILLFTSSNDNISGQFNAFPFFVRNNSLISSNEKPFSLIKPPARSIIPTIFAPS